MWVCVPFRIHTQSSHVGVYGIPYIRTEFMLCVNIYGHTHRVSLWVCMYTCICTRRLHFCVYILTYRCIFAYM